MDVEQRPGPAARDRVVHRRLRRLASANVRPRQDRVAAVPHAVHEDGLRRVQVAPRAAQHDARARHERRLAPLRILVGAFEDLRGGEGKQ